MYGVVSGLVSWSFARETARRLLGNKSTCVKASRCKNLLAKQLTSSQDSHVWSPQIGHQVCTLTNIRREPIYIYTLTNDP